MKDVGDTLYQMLFITLAAIVGIVSLKLLAVRWKFPGTNLLAIV